MARNRRDSTSMTFAVGRGCFLFLVGALCVGFSITKIIVGSEYVNKCPSREMIPVYVIVSGCLPVLLSALRQPYDSGQVSEKERWSNKVTLSTAVVGVMVNLAWLVAGTYLVVTTWSGNICNTPAHQGTGTTSLFPVLSSTSSPNGTLESKYSSSTENVLQSSLGYPKANTNIDMQSNKTFDIGLETDANTTETMQNNNESDGIDLDKVKLVNWTLVKNSIIQRDQLQKKGVDETNNDLLNIEENWRNGIMNDSDKNEENINDEVVLIQDNKHKDMRHEIVNETGEINSKNTKSIESGDNMLVVPDSKMNTVLHEIKINSALNEKSSHDKLCITCDIHILKFSLAVIVIDWIFVAFGIIYFCHFVYYRFSTIKDQILLMSP